MQATHSLTVNQTPVKSLMQRVEADIDLWNLNVNCPLTVGRELTTRV
jgi:hypothetical protein